MQCSYFALGPADYLGCFKDYVNVKKFPCVYGAVFYTSLTIDFCFRGCADDGFKYAALMSIDRQWCLCGNESNVDLARTEPVSESECDTPCNGNLSQICGGRYRISLYRITTVSRDLEVKSVPTSQLYRTAFYGRAISGQPLKSEVMQRNGLIARVECAKACGDTIDCRAFSLSSQTKLCLLFEKTIQLCDANIIDPSTSVLNLV
ncbi:Hypothetical predicted protein [Mytilus galloprovincialis]|uniref:WSC domain-containing protein n=1 Tax=Mytilus galloprovincialis TaxID=29158 RepID=A0A8B6GPP2_MYTGA|nr:Hypothetical predicted protein [Mytilus galloprovincialis]